MLHLAHNITHSNRFDCFLLLYFAALIILFPQINIQFKLWMTLVNVCDLNKKWIYVWFCTAFQICFYFFIISKLVLHDVKLGNCAQFSLLTIYSKKRQIQHFIHLDTDVKLFWFGIKQLLNFFLCVFISSFIFYFPFESKENCKKNCKQCLTMIKFVWVN